MGTVNDFDLAVKSITINPGQYTFAGNSTNFLYSNVGVGAVTLGAPYYSPPAPPAPPAPPFTPENWLRQRVKEVCELAVA